MRLMPRNPSPEPCGFNRIVASVAPAAVAAESLRLPPPKETIGVEPILAVPLPIISSIILWPSGQALLKPNIAWPQPMVVVDGTPKEWRKSSTPFCPKKKKRKKKHTHTHNTHTSGHFESILGSSPRRTACLQEAHRLEYEGEPRGNRGRSNKPVQYWSLRLLPLSILAYSVRT